MNLENKVNKASLNELGKQRKQRTWKQGLV